MEIDLQGVFHNRWFNFPFYFKMLSFGLRCKCPGELHIPPFFPGKVDGGSIAVAVDLMRFEKGVKAAAA